MRRWSQAWVPVVLFHAACTGNIGGLGGDRDGTASGAGSGSAIAEADGGASDSELLQPFVAYESVARRLSQSELDNTVRDLFGDATNPASTFLLEDEYRPYDNDHTVQQASAALIDSLDVMAEDVAARVVGDPATRALIVPCTPSGPGDAACFRQVVETLGPKAFRRPLAPEEVDGYMALQSFATEDNPYVDNDFYTAVELFVRAILQDPEFLYRIEVGTETGTPGIFALDSYEIASRMSYLLWGSTPDEQLLASARSAALVDPDERRRAAERLLADDRARAQLHRFHAMWLGYRAIPHTADLVDAFNEETTRLIDRVVFDESLDYLRLFDMRETYLDSMLADHYGLPAPAGGAQWVAYGPGRAGILSHGSVLAAFSKFSDTSPTQRGIFVRTRLMCQEISPPPAVVDVDQPPGNDEAICKYDRYAQHRELESCATCHEQMDPIGFGLENYDIAGRYREHDDGLPECRIEGRGDVVGFGEFSGPAELGQLLIDNGLLDACVVEQYLTFAVGHELSAVEAQAVETHLARFRDGGRPLTELIIDFVSSEPFGLRKEPEATP